MITVALFNSKGGVGTTTLTYHLAFMLSRFGYEVVAVDLDPQANLTSAFLDEIWLTPLGREGSGQELPTILTSIKPLVEGSGEMEAALTHWIGDRLLLIAGDLGLCQFEEKLADSWLRTVEGRDVEGLRVVSAFHRAIRRVNADVALLDVGPNLSAINRAALLAADYLLVPLTTALFPVKSLSTLGPTVRKWKRDWQVVLKRSGSILSDLPPARVTPIGYVVNQPSTWGDPHAFEKIPFAYREFVLGQTDTSAAEDHCIGTVRNYRSLMPMAQEARKPLFDLTAADGALGSLTQLVRTCEDEFRTLALRIAELAGLKSSHAAGTADSLPNRSS